MVVEEVSLESIVQERKWKVEVGADRICFVRVRISGFVIRLI